MARAAQGCGPCEPLRARQQRRHLGVTQAAGQLEVFALNGSTELPRHAPLWSTSLRCVLPNVPAPGSQIVGRAGVGVDNIDRVAATRHGVIVMNTPGGNTRAAAELTISLLASMLRQVPAAHISMREGKWERKAFTGTEMNGKVLGVIGLGSIGGAVARYAQAFGMKVLGFGETPAAALHWIAQTMPMRCRSHRCCRTSEGSSTRAASAHQLAALSPYALAPQTPRLRQRTPQPWA